MPRFVCRGAIDQLRQVTVANTMTVNSWWPDTRLEHTEDEHASAHSAANGAAECSSMSRLEHAAFRLLSIATRSKLLGWHQNDVLLSELRLLKIALGVIICTLAQLADSSGPHFAQSGSETAVMTTPYRQPAPPNTGASQHRRSGAPAVVRLTKPFL